MLLEWVLCQTPRIKSSGLKYCWFIEYVKNGSWWIWPQWKQRDKSTKDIMAIDGNESACITYINNEVHYMLCILYFNLKNSLTNCMFFVLITLIIRYLDSLLGAAITILLVTRMADNVSIYIEKHMLSILTKVS